MIRQSILRLDVITGGSVLTIWLRFPQCLSDVSWLMASSICRLLRLKCWCVVVWLLGAKCLDMAPGSIVICLGLSVVYDSIRVWAHWSMDSIRLVRLAV